MIGHSTIGKNHLFITGADHTSFATIFRRDTKGILKIAMEPDVRKQLFQRSDNYSFAQQHIPAHSLMASDDEDPCYHQSCDEFQRIDVKNMTAIIRGIAIGCRSIIAGTDTPIPSKHY